MRDNYTEAKCCFNCVWSTYDSYDGTTYCTLIGNNPDKWGTPESKKWAKENQVSDYNVCDDFKI